MKTLARVACTLTLVASSLAAQQRPRGTVFADGAIVRFGEVSGTPAGSFSGPTFGVEGGVSLGSLRLGAGYLEGRVQPSTGSSDSVAKDLVEGYKLGVNSYIQKPVDFNQFRETVKQLGLYWLVVNQSPPSSAFSQR